MSLWLRLVRCDRLLLRRDRRHRDLGRRRMSLWLGMLRCRRLVRRGGRLLRRHRDLRRGGVWLRGCDGRGSVQPARLALRRNRSVGRDRSLRRHLGVRRRRLLVDGLRRTWSERLELGRWFTRSTGRQMRGRPLPGLCRALLPRGVRSGPVLLRRRTGLIGIGRTGIGGSVRRPTVRGPRPLIGRRHTLPSAVQVLLLRWVRPLICGARRVAVVGVVLDLVVVVLVAAPGLAALFLARSGGIGTVALGSGPLEPALGCGGVLDQFVVRKVLNRWRFVLDLLPDLGDLTVGEPRRQHGEAVIAAAHASPSDVLDLGQRSVYATAGFLRGAGSAGFACPGGSAW